MGKIFISGMEFYGFHGCYAEEKYAGSVFEVDVELATDTTRAQLSDNVQDTINYQTVYALVADIMRNTRSNLLEHVANDILTALRAEFPTLDTATVTVRKMHPNMGGKVRCVGVSVS